MGRLSRTCRGFPAAGEMTVLAAAMIGGLARLPLVQLSSGPGLYGRYRRAAAWADCWDCLAVVARQELLLVVVGGVFVVEAGSVIVQVGYYKWRRRRLLRCAPLHHHFQFLGWPENKIVVRFWIAAALCALLGLAGLKLQ